MLCPLHGRPCINQRIFIHIQESYRIELFLTVKVK
jgi:hypothetical protein